MAAIRTVFVASCLAFLGCSRRSADADAQDAGPPAITEAEPNDRSDQAQSIPTRVVVTAALAADPARPDIDLYRLTAPAPIELDATVTGIAGQNIQLDWLDQDRNVLASASAGGEGAGERFPNLRLSGTLWLRVSGAKKGVGGAYTLTLTSRPADAAAEAEPNGRAADATLMGPLPAQGVLQTNGRVGQPSDEDWYKIEVASPSIVASPGAAPPLDPGGDAGPTTDSGASDGSESFSAPVDSLDAGTTARVEEARIALRLDVSAVPGIRWDVAVLSEAEAVLFSVQGKDDEALTLRNVAVRATDRIVYVVVKSGWTGAGKDAKRGANPDLTYTLSVTPEEAGAVAELEPNDTTLKATPLLVGSYREGFLSPKTDVDYYLVRPEAPGIVRLDVSGTERLDLALSVLTPGDEGKPEQVVLRANDGAIKEPEVLNNVRCAPECWVRVEGSTRKVDGKVVHDFENAEQPYRVSASLVVASNVEVEPNNSPEQAIPLSLGQTLRGTVHPKRDTDFYRLDLSERPVRTAFTVTATGILKVDIGLYLWRVSEEGEPTLVQTSDRAKGDAPETIRFSAEPAVYLLEVRDAKNRESNFQDPYQLAVTEGT
ncbi:MAG: ABC transporter substrate-binding protein [Myxococcaceae bacterium]